jgi:protein TonB
VRGASRGLRWALIGSAALHLGVAGLLWAATRGAAEVPRMKVYAVDIVSPPPQMLGEWSPAPTGEPAAAQPEAAPTPPEPAPPEPAPAPQPPAPKAEPVAPKKEAPKEPSPAPKATTPKSPSKAPEKAPAPAKKPAAKGGKAGSGSASTGANPDASSPGGEGLDVHTEGARFMEPGYLENVIRQVNRYFRRPAGSQTDEAEIRFYINRDGSVSDIAIVRSSGSYGFRTAAMEAVEQAGLRKAFGKLPKAYPADRLLISFSFRPAH